MRHLPPLSALPAFEATARLGSVTAAAEALGRTHSAVSKQLKHLSEDLGGALFEKEGTGLKLTARGQRLQARLRPMLEELATLAEALRHEGEAPKMRLAVSATMATRWLMPRLPEFYSLHPTIRVDLIMSGPSRCEADTYDLFLSYDRLRGPTNFTRSGGMPTPLGDTAYGVVCAPDYPLTAEADGWCAPLRLTHAGAPQSWDTWAELSGKPVRAREERAHPHHILALEAAAAGLGVALAEQRLVAADLESGRLICPTGFITVAGGFEAGVPPHAEGDAAVTAFLDWLKSIA